MKWINFSDRLPPNIEEAHMRYADGHEKLIYDYYYWMKGCNVRCEVTHDLKNYVTPTPPDAEWIHFGQWGSGGRYDFNELEWLDESIEPVGIRVRTDKIEELYTPTQIEILLKEQHRNTKHDAAEAVMGYIVDTDCFLDSSSIHSLIMNLKQRKP